MSRNRRHDVDLADQDLEEIAEELWNLFEGGSESLADLKRVSSVQALDAAVDLLRRRGLAELSGDRVILTEAGRDLGGNRARAIGGTDQNRDRIDRRRRPGRRVCHCDGDSLAVLEVSRCS